MILPCYLHFRIVFFFSPSTMKGTFLLVVLAAFALLDLVHGNGKVTLTLQVVEGNPSAGKISFSNDFVFEPNQNNSGRFSGKKTAAAPP